MTNGQQEKLRQQLEKMKEEIERTLDFYFYRLDRKTGKTIQIGNVPPNHGKLNKLLKETEELEKILKSVNNIRHN